MLLAAGALATAALGAGATVIVAAESEGGEAPSSPGTPDHPTEAAAAEDLLGRPRTIETSGAFDETELTKFIPGSAFSSLGLFGYTSGGNCVFQGGTLLPAYAAVELPDGARINQIRFFGEDSTAADITVSLHRENFQVPTVFGTPTRSSETVDVFTTDGVSGSISLGGATDLNEVVGSFTSGTGGIGTTVVNHRFHTVRVEMDSALHQLCGVEVLYQVPAAEKESGSVYVPIDPVRAYDSRQTGFPVSGLLAPNQSRTISVKDGHDGSTVAAPDVVPSSATAVTYNLTVTGLTGANYAAITPGDANGSTASAINWNGTADVANAGTVSLDSNRQVTVWAGDQPGSFQFIVDITGYYAPPTNSHPNMGN